MFLVDISINYRDRRKKGHTIFSEMIQELVRRTSSVVFIKQNGVFGIELER